MVSISIFSSFLLALPFALPRSSIRLQTDRPTTAPLCHIHSLTLSLLAARVIIFPASPSPSPSCTHCALRRANKLSGPQERYPNVNLFSDASPGRRGRRVRRVLGEEAELDH